jgi:HPt (histidine-containing phosphotransfer) domain-containing protein
VSGELDATRLPELRDALGTDVSEIINTLDNELARAIGQLEKGLEAGRLDAVAQAAHAARNSALMLDAQPLMHALRELETAARSEDLAGARGALPALREVWPALRRRLAAEAQRADRG